MRIAFLIGAGASYGSGVVVPRQPPLGGQLFPELQRALPQSWGALSGHLAKLFEQDFERGMDRLWAQQQHRDLSPLLNDMGRYFVRFEPARREANRYSELLFMLRAKGLLSSCVFASLNYECILEIAAARLDLGLAFSIGVAAPNVVRVLKPHGSCNFLPPWDPVGFGVVITGVGQYYNAVKVTSIDEARQRYQRPGAFLPPVMSLFAPKKLTPAAKEFIDAIRGQWRDWVLSCDAVAVIGSRPNLYDGHVWGPIAESKARVWHLGGTEDDYAEFSRRLGNRLEYLGHYFDDAGLNSLTAAILRL